MSDLSQEMSSLMRISNQPQTDFGVLGDSSFVEMSAVRLPERSTVKGFLICPVLKWSVRRELLDVQEMLKL